MSDCHEKAPPRVATGTGRKETNCGKSSITAGDRLIYISDTVNPVPVTGPAGPVEVVVVPVARGDE